MYTYGSTAAPNQTSDFSYSPYQQQHQEWIPTQGSSNYLNPLPTSAGGSNPPPTKRSRSSLMVGAQQPSTSHGTASGPSLRSEEGENYTTNDEHILEEREGCWKRFFASSSFYSPTILDFAAFKCYYIVLSSSIMWMCALVNLNLNIHTPGRRLCVLAAVLILYDLYFELKLVKCNYIN